MRKPVRLRIAQLGYPILRRKARLVKDVHDKEIQKLIDDMIETIRAVDGVGLSAPQVYKSIRLLVIASRSSPRYPDAPTLKPVVMINPKIVAHAKTVLKRWEGCLSLPGIRALIPRYSSVNVEYINRKGKERKGKFAGFIAQVIQHEYDHLEGIVFFDRLESSKDVMMEKEYQKRILRVTR